MKVQLKNTNKADDTKLVKYFGLELVVPKNTVAIATDADGEVYAYLNHAPVINVHSQGGYWGLSDDLDADADELDFLEVTFDNPDEWKESLVEYSLEG